MVIGGYFVAGTDVQFSLLSLDDTLGLNWDTLYNPASGDDRLMDLAVTEDGNIFVTGHKQLASGDFACFTAQFEAGGDLAWSQEYQAPKGSAYGKKLSINPSGFLNITGISIDNTDTNILILQYDPTGRLRFSQEYDAGGAEVAANIETDFWGNIYVHGTSSASGSGYVTMKYGTFTRSLNAINDTVNGAKYADNEIIVRVHPSLVDTAAVDNCGKTFGLFQDFVQPEVIDTLNTLFEGSYHFGRFPAVKAFKRFTTAIEYSITRTGDTIDVPPFWATFRLQLPETLPETDAASAIGSKRSVVKFAEVNLLADDYDLPNDSRFTSGDQKGLESSEVPDFDIEMDRAWDIHHGSPSGRLGILDGGINWSHDDLSIDGTNTFAGSKVAGGWNWPSNAPISSTNDADVTLHGSKVAGIAAALRNNNGIGVAGIAGGDLDNGNPGCELFVFDLKPGKSPINHADAAEAVAEAALDDPGADPPGYALHVLSISWGHPYYTNGIASLRESVEFAYNNDCVVVCASGNQGTAVVDYPSSFHEPWVIKVGANDKTGARAPFSTFGYGIDIIAPGVDSIWYGLHGSPQFNNITLTGEGTSYAAPHVAGGAALLISYVNDHWTPNPLASDDVEFLLGRYASDVGAPNYDDTNGFGRLNMGEVMEHMEWPYYWVEHFNGITTSYTTTAEQANAQVTIDWIDGLPTGVYLVDRYKVECTVSHNLGNATLLNSWIRNGKANSTLLADNNTWKEGWPGAELVSTTATTATIRGYIYKIKDLLSGFVVTTYPFADGAPLKYAYSLHLYDENATGIEPDKQAGNGAAVLYPNPARDQQRLRLAASEHTVIELIDLHGRVVETVFAGKTQKGQAVSIPIHHLAPGWYCYRLRAEHSHQVIPFVKH